MDPRSALLLGIALLTTSLAGCLSFTDDPIDETAGVDDAATMAYVPVDGQALSQPAYEIGPRIAERVTVSVGDVDLYLERWLPEGEGPFPTVLHSTPYSHLDRSIEASGPVTGISAAHEFWVERGYAYVVADVRGFGESEGCVEVWGPGEQQDQADLVEWIAEQSWSDGNVGMIGVSYPGTTPIEAAVQAPSPLKAIVAVAGLTDPYYDWHYGGVPNGESGPAGSPAAYQGIGAVVPMDPTHGTDWAESVADAGCETPSLVLDAYQSDGTYTDFYEARNFSARADAVEAAVLYTQGFDDFNVKPSQLMRWFNAIDAPKKGIFGPWGHTTPPREDWTDLTLAWFDEHLKGKDTRVREGPTVEMHTNLDTWRADTAFPSNRTSLRPAFLNASEALTWAPGQAGSLELETGRADSTVDTFRSEVVPGEEPERLVLRTEPLEEALYLSGQARLSMDLTLEGAENTFLRADLNAVDGDATQAATFGELNLALRNDVTSYEPVPTGEPFDATLRFQPAEQILEAGTVLELVLEPIDLTESDTPEAAGSSTLTLHTGPDATQLQLPVLDGRPDIQRPDEV